MILSDRTVHCGLDQSKYRLTGGGLRHRKRDSEIPGPRRRRSLTLRSHCPVGDARLNKVLGCFGPRVETDLPEHFAVLLGVHVVVPKGAISSKKVGCDGLDRCGQFVEQCSRLQVSTVLRVLGSLGAPPVGGLLKVQSQRFPYFLIGHFGPPAKSGLRRCQRSAHSPRKVLATENGTPLPGAFAKPRAIRRIGPALRRPTVSKRHRARLPR